MACNICRTPIVVLYRNLLNESKKWNNYNYREYALRKIRHEFRENKNVCGEEEVKRLLKKGQDSLEMIKRQAVIGNFYTKDKLVIELKKNQGRV